MKCMDTGRIERVWLGPTAYYQKRESAYVEQRRPPWWGIRPELESDEECGMQMKRNIQGPLEGAHDDNAEANG